MSGMRMPPSRVDRRAACLSIRGLWARVEPILRVSRSELLAHINLSMSCVSAVVKVGGGIIELSSYRTFPSVKALTSFALPWGPWCETLHLAMASFSVTYLDAKYLVVSKSFPMGIPRETMASPSSQYFSPGTIPLGR